MGEALRTHLLHQKGSSQPMLDLLLSLVIDIGNGLQVLLHASLCWACSNNSLSSSTVAPPHALPAAQYLHDKNIIHGGVCQLLRIFGVQTSLAADPQTLPCRLEA
jgi:hypothetical protein